MKHIHIRSLRGITILELMIATLMIGLVFAVAMSVYQSSYRFLNIQMTSTSDPTLNPVVVLEDIAKRISLCNEITGNANTIHLRCDYAFDSYNALNTPSNTADDNYWHYRFIAGQLIVAPSDGTTPNMNPNPGIAPARTIIPNVNTGASSFAINQASTVGTSATRVDISVTTSVAPITQTRTSAILGARSTR